MTGQVSIADRTHLDQVIDTITDAFGDLDLTSWLVPDPAQRRQALRGHLYLITAHALDHGVVYLADGGAGAAVWYDRTRDIPDPADYDAQLTLLCGRHADRFRLLDAAFAAHAPTSPHHHLALLAVTPTRQGTGLGTALLRAHHDRLPTGVPAYLEASSTRARDLYTRHGYRAEQPFCLPEGGPPLWPMWRR